MVHVKVRVNTIKVVCIRVRSAKPRSTVLYTLCQFSTQFERSSYLPSFLYTGFFIPAAVFRHRFKSFSHSLIKIFSLLRS